MSDPAQCGAFNAKRYAWVKKGIEHTEVVEGATANKTIVYSLGTLYGAWPDGAIFEGNRYIVRDSLITRMDVWNESAEWMLTRADLAEDAS
jgi:hypothetical protein